MRRRSPRSPGSGAGRCARCRARRTPTPTPWSTRRSTRTDESALAVQPDRQRLELVDERRLGVVALAGQLDAGVALERLLDERAQLQPRERGAQAEVPAARAEGLVLGVALDVEVVGVLVDVLVAVGRHVPHGHLVALADDLAAQLDLARRRAAKVREGGEHAQRLLDGARD